MIKSHDLLVFLKKMDFSGLLDKNAVILKMVDNCGKERPNFFIETVNILKLKL